VHELYRDGSMGIRLIATGLLSSLFSGRQRVLHGITGESPVHTAAMVQENNVGVFHPPVDECPGAKVRMTGWRGDHRGRALPRAPEPHRVRETKSPGSRLTFSR
jgi:hypothetical protein